MASDPAPKVFMSYSWDGDEHQAWVLKLATRLRVEGVDVVLDVWDARLGGDLALFMEQAADTSFRVLAVVSERYVQKANNAQGGVGYERRVITPTLMADLTSHRVVPLLVRNPGGELPRFMGAARFTDFRDPASYEASYFELLLDLHGMELSPKPALGPNPFVSTDPSAMQASVRQDPARYVSPALQGRVQGFNYANNNGRYVVGSGDRTFTLDFSTAGYGSVHIYNDPRDIVSVALAPSAKALEEIGDPLVYDSSSRARKIAVGDAAILRNANGYWAAVFIEEVFVRGTGPTGEESMTFRYAISPLPSPAFQSA